jgi:hypothetical protein
MLVISSTLAISPPTVPSTFVIVVTSMFAGSAVACSTAAASPQAETTAQLEIV